jgi:hypothetical protein
VPTREKSRKDNKINAAQTEKPSTQRAFYWSDALESIKTGFSESQESGFVFPSFSEVSKKSLFPKGEIRGGQIFRWDELLMS